MNPQITILAAEKQDAGLILSFIRKMAAYEKMSDQVTATEESLRHFLFERKAAEVLIAEWSGSPAGFALFFENFSTFMGRTGLYLEDIYVDEDKRGLGIGKALFQAVAAEAVKCGCQRVDWVCLDWNKPARDFYHKMNAKNLDEWVLYRLSGEEIADVAKK